MTDAQITDLRKFIGDGFDQLRTEFSAQISALGTELRVEMAEFRIELRTELRAEINDLGIELRSEMAQLRTDMNRRFSRQDEKLDEILTAIGERFDRNEKTIDSHGQCIVRLEKRTA